MSCNISCVGSAEGKGDGVRVGVHAHGLLRRHEDGEEAAEEGGPEDRGRYG